MFSIRELFNKDTRTIFKALRAEERRQKKEICLIASENWVSNDVLKGCGHTIQQKYAEGYPSKRYYSGCENVDIIENKAIELAKKLLRTQYANVQAHSGSTANLGAYYAACKYWNVKPSEVMGIGFDLNSGGHLTHFNPMAFPGVIFESVTYGLNQNGLIDYTKIEELLLEHSVKNERKVILNLGYSAYTRSIDYKRLSKFIRENKIKCVIVHDTSHFTGLMVAGLYSNPMDFDWGDSIAILTTTTHKTFRCARHAIIATDDLEMARCIDSAIFPGLQGGPLSNMIAGVAIGLAEADTPAFVKYQTNVLANMQALISGIRVSNSLIKFVLDGTDNHMCLLDLRDTMYTGKEAEDLLKLHNIVCNRNTLVGDKVTTPSGIRIGSAYMTSKGWKQKDFYKLGVKIGKILECAPCEA